MALESNPFIPADGTIAISDATGPPITLTVQYEEGDFSFEEVSASHYDVEVFLDRGIPYAGRQTMKRPVNISFTAHATDFTDGTEKCLIDAFGKTGAFAAGVTTNPSGDAWMVQIVFTAAPGGASKTATFKKCWGKVGFSEGTPGKFAIKATAYAFADSDIAFT